jgi:hypothetical protein
MTGRETLLAEIEAKRRKQAADPIEVLQTNLSCSAEDTGYNPYDNPGPAKPLRVDSDASSRPRRRARR